MALNRELCCRRYCYENWLSENIKFDFLKLFFFKMEIGKNGKTIKDISNVSASWRIHRADSELRLRMIICLNFKTIVFLLIQSDFKTSLKLFLKTS